MALDSTVAGQAANSYLPLEDADAYFANHYSLTKGSTWAGLAVSQKESVLRRACQILEKLRVLDQEYGAGAWPTALERDLYLYNVHRYGIGQRLNFPRNLDVQPNGQPFVPQDVKDAQCEQAFYLLAFDEAPLQARLSGIAEESISAGPVRSDTTYRTDGSMLAPMAMELMRDFIRPTNRVRRA